MPKIKTQDGININYNVYGDGAPLLLLAGLGESGSYWDKHVNVYKEHFMCIVPDNRGSGESDKPEGEYTTEQMAYDAISVLNDLGIEKYSISGVGMGAAIAQQVMIKHNRKPNCCILTLTFARCNDDTLSKYNELKTACGSLPHDEFLKEFYSYLYKPQYLEENPNSLDEFITRHKSEKTIMPPYAFEAQIEACISHNTLNEVTRLPLIPYMYITWEHDASTPGYYAMEMHQRTINSRLDPLRGAHAHNPDEIERYNELTLDFLLKENRL